MPLVRFTISALTIKFPDKSVFQLSACQILLHMHMLILLFEIIIRFLFLTCSK